MLRFWIALFVGIAATTEDLVRRQISNTISVAALVAGALLSTFEHGARGLLMSLLGALVGGSVFLIFYLMGGMGGGDIKLMAGFGAIVGFSDILVAALWTGACGGLLAAAMIGGCWLCQLWGGSPELLTRFRKRPESLPYAPAITLGVLLSFVGRS